MERKRLPMLIGVILLTAILVAVPLVGCAEERAEEPDWELMVQANQVPGDKPLWMVPAHFAELVDEYTNGRVFVNVRPKNELVSMREALEAVSTGVVPAITPFADYLSGSHPELMFFEVPGLVENPAEDLQPILDAGVWDILDESLAKDNAKLVMYWTRGHAASIACKTHHLRSPEDFEGIQISAPGGLLSEIIRAIGGAVTPIPGPELYMSLQTGVIDACFTSIDAGVLGEKTYEVAPYVVWYPEDLTGENPYVLLINLDVWNGFPGDIQEDILKAGRETSEFAAEYTYDYLDGVEAQLAAVGVTVEHLTDAETAVLLGLTKEQVRQWWLEQTGDLGSQIIDIIAEYYK